jgi:hypothetical protein
MLEFFHGKYCRIGQEWKNGVQQSTSKESKKSTQQKPTHTHNTDGTTITSSATGNRQV